jgi:hypothetical protein
MAGQTLSFLAKMAKFSVTSTATTTALRLEGKPGIVHDAVTAPKPGSATVGWRRGARAAMTPRGKSKAPCLAADALS